MKIIFFSSQKYDQEFFVKENQKFNFELFFCESHLNAYTAELAKGFDVICAFVNDTLDASTLIKLQELGIKLIALRCAGFNNVDLKTAKELDIKVVRVPAYSPYAVAEHTLALILSLNRKIHKAYNRTREGNFSLNGLLGFDLHGKVAGVIGTGKIGCIVVDLLAAFGCKVLAYDPFSKCDLPNAEYVSLDDLLSKSNIVSLHCPLSENTKHLINQANIEKMQDGVMIINTSRGGLIDTHAVIEGLKSKKIGYLGIDVYEEEGNIFFEDLSNSVIQDDVLMRLFTFPNVIVTGHQAFFTNNALENIAHTTLGNILEFSQGKTLTNQVNVL